MVKSTHMYCVAIILICVKESHLNDAHAAAANKYAFQAVHSPCMYFFVHSYFVEVRLQKHMNRWGNFESYSSRVGNMFYIISR